MAKKTKRGVVRKKKFAVGGAKGGKDGFSITIETGGEVFVADTDSLVAALQAFKPTILKTETVIRVKKGRKTVEKFLSVPIARRTFSNSLSAELLAYSFLQALGLPKA